MNTVNTIPPFQLYEKASLQNIIESYRENLEWSVIQVEPEEAFVESELLEKAKKGTAVYTVKTILLPEKHGRIFMAYARDVTKDFEGRLTALLREKTMLIARLSHF